MARPGVRGTFSQPGPSHPAAGVRLARTLGLAFNLLLSLAHKEYTVADLNTVFSELRAIMAPYAEKLDAKTDVGTELYLDTKHLQKNKKPLFFGAVQVKKTYVSFHLMPVYLKPELLEGVSPELTARMQGKSCFNFASSDKLLFKELAGLTKAAYASYREQGFV